MGNSSDIIKIRNMLDCEPKIAELYRYWLQCRGDGDVPDRVDIDPVSMNPKLLPNVFLYDLYDGGQRVRTRLLGTAVTLQMGGDHTGRWLEEYLAPQPLAMVTASMVDLCTERRPFLSEGLAVIAAREFQMVRRLLLPLRNGGTDIAICLGIALFVAREDSDSGQLHTDSLGFKSWRAVIPATFDSP